MTINLRSEFFPSPYLAIAAISITPSNQGKGLIVLDWFKTFAKEKGFQRLVLQEIIAEEGYLFALKNAFTKTINLYEKTFGNQNSIDGDFELHLT